MVIVLYGSEALVAYRQCNAVFDDDDDEPLTNAYGIDADLQCHLNKL